MFPFQSEMAGMKESPRNRSGARTPELISPIPEPSRSAIFTPNYDQVTARQTEEKATSPFPQYPNFFTPPPPGGDMYDGIGTSYPDKHHFTGQAY
jgi:hypothetical protein